MNIIKIVLFALAIVGWMSVGTANAQGIKWHPGHYVMFATVRLTGSTSRQYG